MPAQRPIPTFLRWPGLPIHLPSCLPTCPPACPQENRLAQHTIQALQSELDSLRADNIKLFEKIKFLQSYPGRVSTLPNFNPRVPGRERGGPDTPRRKVRGPSAWVVSL